MSQTQLAEIEDHLKALAQQLAKLNLEQNEVITEPTQILVQTETVQNDIEALKTRLAKKVPTFREFRKK